MPTMLRSALQIFAIMSTALLSACQPTADDVPSESPTSESGAQGEDLWAAINEIAIVDEMVMMPMRDGVRLATHIYRPKTSDGTPVPTVFVKTPYNMNLWGNGEMNTRRFRGPLEAVRRGYAYVNQNERGKFFSEGEWDILGPPKTDGYDALTWIAGQALVEREGRYVRLLFDGRVADGPRVSRSSGARGHGPAGIRCRRRTHRRLVRAGELVSGRRRADALLLLAVRSPEHAAPPVLDPISMRTTGRASPATSTWRPSCRV